MTVTRAAFTFRSSWVRAAVALAIVTGTALTAVETRQARALESVPGAQSPVTVAAAAGQAGWVLRDADGREVTLRGFNVSGSTKLAETDLLPFRSTADAALSAQAMRDQTGANVIRFLISWEGVQPTPGSIDTAYLDRVVAQIQAFTDRGIYVLLDYHQDLYSPHLFNNGSWYTGDGAPPG